MHLRGMRTGVRIDHAHIADDAVDLGLFERHGGGVLTTQEKTEGEGVENTESAHRKRPETGGIVIMENIIARKFFIRARASAPPKSAPITFASPVETRFQR
jgi:hypothetical protein